MVFLGLEINTITITIGIPQGKLIEIRLELDKWFINRRVTKKQVQRLVRLLNFAAHCVKPGRIYFSRVLNFLRNIGKHALVDEGTINDIHWWKVLANDFNGMSLIINDKWEEPSQMVHSDACLSGIGALTDLEFFHFALPAWCREIFTDINQIEWFAILIAVRVWGHQ